MIAAMHTTQPMPLANDTEEGRAVACARSNPTELTPWVLAAAAGDTRAFGHLVEATSGLVTAIALAISRDAEQSKDLAQDVFVAAWRDLSRLRDPASFLPWLRQMTRNQAHASLRGRVRRRRWLLPMHEQLRAEHVHDGRPSASDELVAAEEQAILCEALAQLPKETREIVTLFYMEQQSVAQTAALLQLSEDATKKRLSRARRSLRQDVLERFGEAICASAPGAAFGAAVVAALPLSASGTASAMTFATAKAAGGGSAGSTWAHLAWLLKFAIPGMVFAPFLAFAWFMARFRQRSAHDARERRQVGWFWAAQTLVSIIAIIGFAKMRKYDFQHWGDVSVLAAYTVALLALNFGWWPRIVRRRYEAQMLEDPAKASAARRHEKLGRTIGWSLGLGGSWVAMIIKHVYFVH